MNNDTYTLLRSAKDIVLSFIRELNVQNFNAAKEYVDENIRFEGAMGSRYGIDAYFTGIQQMRLEYNIKKIFTDGDDVCLMYDFTTSGITIFGCGWYHVKDEKIDVLKVIFDPRSILSATRR
ncbi:MAG: nuclear transport factor 2 family protein [Ferruginibacter sp.]